MWGTAYIQPGMETFTLLEPMRAETQKEFFVGYSSFDLDLHTCLISQINQPQICHCWAQQIQTWVLVVGGGGQSLIAPESETLTNSILVTGVVGSSQLWPPPVSAAAESLGMGPSSHIPTSSPRDWYVLQKSWEPVFQVKNKNSSVNAWDYWEILTNFNAF